MSEGGANMDMVAAEKLSSREIALTSLAGAAAVVMSVRVAPGLAGAAGAALAVIMLAIAVADWRRLIIPDALSLAAAALGVADIAWENSGADFIGITVDAMMRAATMAALFLIFRVVYRWARGRDGMGLGDVKLAGVAGLWLQADTLSVTVEIAALMGIVVAMVRLWRSGARFDPVAKLPFGAFLAPTIWLCWLFERWSA